MPPGRCAFRVTTLIGEIIVTIRTGACYRTERTHRLDCKANQKPVLQAVRDFDGVVVWRDQFAFMNASFQH